MQENCNVVPEWSDAVIIDARGFTRASSSDGLYLVAYSGSTSTPDLTWDPPAGNSSLFFQLGNQVIARVDIPDGLSVFPFVAHATVDDQNSQAPLAGIMVTIGSAWLDLSASDRFLFGTTAPLENSVIVDLYRQQVDLIQILHSNGVTEDFEGDVVIRGGHNTGVIQKNSDIQIASSPGHGELGSYDGEGPGDLCRDLIYSISGARATNSGNIKFIAGKGIEVLSLPNTIQITLKTSELAPVGGCHE